ncbi:MAG TPA: hypothetical protein VFU55_11035 [Terracidiphilus sp.]|nr:hypothetical protein [Terracidiphilus sp.]
MKLHRFAVPALAVLMSAGGVGMVQAAGAQDGPPPGYYGQGQQPGYYGQQPGNWDAPRGFNDIERQGFRDGVDGAQKDFGNRRQPNVNNRDEYRNPHLPREMRDDYREGFRRGYYVAMRRLMGNGQSYAPMPERPWDMPPDAYGDVEQRGFRDGIIGARKDYENHRRPNVNNRDEYRDPDLPGGQRQVYRQAFRRGYADGVRHYYGMSYGRDDDDRDRY